MARGRPACATVSWSAPDMKLEGAGLTTTLRSPCTSITASAALGAAIGQEAEDAVDARPAVGAGDRLGREVAAWLQPREMAGERHGIVGERRQPVRRPAVGGDELALEIGAPRRIGRGIPGAAAASPPSRCRARPTRRCRSAERTGCRCRRRRARPAPSTGGAAPPAPGWQACSLRRSWLAGEPLGGGAEIGALRS